MTIVWLLVFILSACSPAAATPGSVATLLPSATPGPTFTATPTSSPIPTETPVRTPPALPGTFLTDLLNPNDPAHTYIPDACQYLRDKWSSANSAPGTIAIVVMFHSIVSNDMIPNANQITEKKFNDLMGDLMSRGFEAVTTLQLAD